MSIKKLLLLLVFTPLFSCSQESFTSQLYTSYADYKEATLHERRIKHKQLQPLIAALDANPKFKVQKVGKSIEGRALNLISIGEGKTSIFLWSQMHGNEPTATQAIFDIFKFLDSKEFESEKKEILSKLSLHFLPMLNPDGAEQYQRRNALGIDINRDALRLQSPEGQVLKKIRDSLNADFGFNLHDQSTYYNAERTEKPATISYLATAYNYEKDINEVRSKAMQVIVFMNTIIQKYAPGQVGRYSDDFEPRAFGDNIAKWGTSLILIESGGYANDKEKQEIRKLNYVSILSALHTIAQETYKEIPIAEYVKIPRNDRNLFDLKLENLTYELRGKEYTLDLGIYQQEVDLIDQDVFYYKSIIEDQGDLSTYYGYETFDAEGYTLVPPRTDFKTDVSLGEIPSLLRQGYAHFKSSATADGAYFGKPMHMVIEDAVVPEFKIGVGANPTFFLRKDGKLTHAVINGFLIDLQKEIPVSFKGNGLIFR